MRASLSDAIKKAEVVVICCNDKEIEELLLKEGHDKAIVDLVGLRRLKNSGNGYSGIAW